MVVPKIAICLVVVGFKLGGIPFLQKVELTGKIIRSGKAYYVVDFSEDLKKNKFMNPENYKRRTVLKNECVVE